jgi:hypothetical protein
MQLESEPKICIIHTSFNQLEDLNLFEPLFPIRETLKLALLAMSHSESKI